MPKATGGKAYRLTLGDATMPPLFPPVTYRLWPVSILPLRPHYGNMSPAFSLVSVGLGGIGWYMSANPATGKQGRAKKISMGHGLVRGMASEVLR